ncbi:MAG: helicase-associated domain-containing protein [Spirochaetia bacterium]|nr:helicase-associated domain-containing protein [Spirochaetia bacterium]
MIVEELEKLETEQISRIAEIWGISKDITDRKRLIQAINETTTNAYFLKGILEKLTPVQVKIYSVIIESRSILTLGEISRKIHMQPINVEKELTVLRHLMLVYLRKNRERITSNLDKYYPFEDIRKIIKIKNNDNGEIFRFSLEKEIPLLAPENLDKEYQKIIGGLSLAKKEISANAIDKKTIEKILGLLNEKEIHLVDEAFSNGGMIEIHSARILIDELKIPLEETIRKLDRLNILKDIYYVDERFVRVLVLPEEIFEYLRINPLFPQVRGVKQTHDKRVSNYLDFILNIKKLILYISNKGLSLAQSEKLKQVDMKKSESSLIDMDTELFLEKSQIPQIEIILPFLKMFELVELKGENIVLKENFEEFIKINPIELMKKILEQTPIAAEKRQVGNEVFLPLDVPFYKSQILEKCVNIIAHSKEIYSKVLVADMIRDWIVLSPGFKIRDFKNIFIEKRNLIVSALFYLHIFGMFEIEYPKRRIKFSQLGMHFFFEGEINEENQKGGIIINPDATVVAMPDKLSIMGLHLLKSFSILKDYDQVYNFQLTKESLQQGLLLGNDIETFIEFLNDVSKNRIPQNVMFLINSWSEDLPIVTIEEDVVLLETSDIKLTELLKGQTKGKKIIKKELSATALVISKNKIAEVMEIAEKNEMIVKLIR